MDPLILIITFSFLLILPLYFLLKTKSPKRVPPGSLGLPIIGQSLSLLRALNQDTAGTWLKERSRKYGPVSKMNVFGSPTVFIHGPAASKFIYTSNCVSSETPSSVRKIFGERGIFELSGYEHKRVRAALVSFLKPEVLKQYVGKMDQEIRTQIKIHWNGKEKISAMPFMETLTFNIMSSFIVGIEQGTRRESLNKFFHHILDGLLSVPINLPFTKFNRSLKSRSKIENIIAELIQEKRAALEQQKTSPQQDLLTSLISLRNEDNSPMLSDEDIRRQCYFYNDCRP
ncbi:taxane 10-beta-hydroxylase-like [Euphorbia lathyris]|uniref:taxane 10-beta-hydroxylase-like n=1 Tax=Euphorbia lathyris TaxID=212925 RepID=UPI0033137552